MGRELHDGDPLRSTGAGLHRGPLPGVGPGGAGGAGASPRCASSTVSSRAVRARLSAGPVDVVVLRWAARTTARRDGTTLLAHFQGVKFLDELRKFLSRRR